MPVGPVEAEASTTDKIRHLLLSQQFMALGRFGKADDIANAVVFLASAKARTLGEISVRR